MDPTDAIPQYFECPRVPQADIAGVDAFLAHWHERFGITSAPLQHTVSTYLEYCSPRNASAAGLEANAAYLAWFFAVNDTPASANKLAVQGRVRGVLRGSAAGDDPLERSTEAFVEIVRGLGIELPGSTLMRRLELMFHAFDWEVRVQGTLPPVAEYVEHRRHFVAVYPYLELWRVAEGADVPPALSGPLQRLEDLSVDLTYLVNDILSTTRDTKWKKLNLVFCVANERGCSTPEALDVARSLLDDRVKDYRRAVDEVRRSAQMHTALATYVEFLGSIAEGTRVAMLKLQARYRSADPV